MTTLCPIQCKTLVMQGEQSLYSQEGGMFKNKDRKNNQIKTTNRMLEKNKIVSHVTKDLSKGPGEYWETVDLGLNMVVMDLGEWDSQRMRNYYGWGTQDKGGYCMGGQRLTR